MHRLEFSAFSALGIVLALTLSVPFNPQHDNENVTEVGPEILSPVEGPRGEAEMLDRALPLCDPVLPDDGTRVDEGPFNPD